MHPLYSVFLSPSLPELSPSPKLGPQTVFVAQFFYYSFFPRLCSFVLDNKAPRSFLSLAFFPNAPLPRIVFRGSSLPWCFFQESAFRPDAPFSFFSLSSRVVPFPPPADEIKTKLFNPLRLSGRAIDLVIPIFSRFPALTPPSRRSKRLPEDALDLSFPPWTRSSFFKPSAPHIAPNPSLTSRPSLFGIHRDITQSMTPFSRGETDQPRCPPLRAFHSGFPLSPYSPVR